MDWEDYKAHFLTCAQANGWSEKQMAIYLGYNLRETPQYFTASLPVEKRWESLQEMSVEIRSLAELAHPGQNNEMRDSIVLAHFIWAIDDDHVRFVTNVSKRPPLCSGYCSTHVQCSGYRTE